MSPPDGLISARAVRLESFWIALLVWTGAAIVLYLAAEPPSYPTVFPDEICRLGWARWLSGTGPHYVMGSASYCQPAYPLLIAPLYWISSEPDQVFRNIFLVNSFLVAATLPLTVRLAMKHFSLSITQAWLAGVAVLAFPALTLHSHHAWPETALYPLVLLVFFAYGNWVDRPDWRRFFWLVVAGVALYAVHRKMLVFPVALVAGVLIGLLYDRTQRYRVRALLLVLGILIVFLILDRFKFLAMSAFWQQADYDIVGRFTRPSPLEFAENLAGRVSGQMFYAAIVTGGCVWLALAGGFQSLVRGIRRGFGSLGKLGRVSAFVLVMLLLMAIETAVFVIGSTRFDSWFYGRHINPLVAVSLVPAIALVCRGLVDGKLLRATVALIIVTILMGLIALPAPVWTDYSPVHVLGAGPFIDWLYAAETRGQLLARCAALVAASSAVCLAILPGRWRYMALLPFAVATIAIHLTTRPFVGVTAEEAFPAPVANALNRDESCAIFWDRRLRGRTTVHQFWRIQYHFPHCAIEFRVPEDCDIPGSFLITQERRLDCSETRDPLFLPPDMVLYPSEGEGT